MIKLRNTIVWMTLNSIILIYSSKNGNNWEEMSNYEFESYNNKLQICGIFKVLKCMYGKKTNQCTPA
jgi:hypothetical protein